MRMQRWIRRTIPFTAVSAALLLGAAPALFAQGQQLFEWSGRVDREKQIVMRGGQVWTNNIGATEPRQARARTFMALPPQNGEVVVQMLSGRGRADVIQQPNAGNGYTTIVRIQDPESGSDNYRVAAYWQNYANGEVMGRNRGRRQRDCDEDDRNCNSNGQYNNGQYNNGRYGQYGQYGQYNRQYGNQSLLHWSGNVDDELEIRIQNGGVGYRTISGAQPTGIRASLGNVNMPRANANVSVVQNQGRGSVTVVQQPAAWNGYTTVVRVRDPQGGYGFYDFDLVWQ